MNERIRELIAQAREPLHNKDLPFNQGLMEYSEKFAELIVKECASFIDSHEQVDKYGEAMDIVYGKDLLKHFGVDDDQA